MPETWTIESFPPVIGLDGLSRLLNKSPSSILADRCRAPWRVPPACTPPGSKQPLWITEDVIAWLRQHREPPSPTCADHQQPAPRRRGRPTKRRQLESLQALPESTGSGA